MIPSSWSASVRSSLEEDFFGKLLISYEATNLWIGMHRNSSGIFTWSNGCPLDYKKWNAGEPTSQADKTFVAFRLLNVKVANTKSFRLAVATMLRMVHYALRRQIDREAKTNYFPGTTTLTTQQKTLWSYSTF